ncbi:MAG: RNA pyrophosphohydrolase [Sphingomonadales bacterium]|nr:RNA pyrophosphohydrolase [Sphingomonadales bacterium]
MTRSPLPYRPCAGVMLVNAEKRVFVGQRIDHREHRWKDAWQMPQGGIDPGEDAETAAYRELEEETGIARQQVELIARASKDLRYDLPDELVGKVWGGRYCGQLQSWFLMRFHGEDSDIDLEAHKPEFSAWQWVEPHRLPELIVPFKRTLYEQLLEEFSEYLR